MRMFAALAAWTAVGGCLTLDKFNKKYKEKYCEEYEACGGDGPCPIEEQESAGLDYGPDCSDEEAFDKDAARACLDNPWECSDTVPTAVFPLVPLACADACGLTEVTS